MRSVWIVPVSLIDEDRITQRVPAEQKRRWSGNNTGHQPLWEAQGKRSQCRRLEGSVGSTSGWWWRRRHQGGMAFTTEVAEKSSQEKRATVLQTRTQGCSKKTFSVMALWGEGVRVPRLTGYLMTKNRSSCKLGDRRSYVRKAMQTVARVPITDSKFYPPPSFFFF